MDIRKVYKTSKGTFWSRDAAEKKSNRVKLNGSRPGDPVEYEPVREGYVLISTVETDAGIRGLGSVTCVFELNEIEVK